MSAARTVLITGASSGIGAELARLFAGIGDHLVLTARRGDRLQALAGDLAAKHGVRVEAITADLSKPEAPKELLIEAGRRGLIVDVLVNTAGFGLRGRFAKLPYNRQLEMVQVNVTAPTALAALLLPGMLARKRGGILNVASLAAYQAGPNMAVYYASKAYLLSFSEALFEEAKPHGVTVTALCPGPVPTEFASVADLQGTRLFKIGAVGAEEVARAGFAGFQRGRAVVIPGGAPKLGAVVAKVSPRALTRKLAALLQAVKD